MRRRENLVELDALAQRYGKRPSEMLGVDGWAGYQLDLAVLYGALEARDDQARGGQWPAGGSSANKFRTPTVKRKMRISENGVW